MSYGKDRTVLSVTIPNGGSLSGEVNLNGKRLVGIAMPAAWDAAGIAFQALLDEPSALPKVPVFGNVVDTAGAAVAITAAAGTYIAIPTTFTGYALGRIKVRSGTNAAPVNQTADRIVKLIVVDI